MHHRQLFPHTGLPKKGKKKSYKKTVGSVSSSLFLAQVARQEKENQAPSALDALADVATASGKEPAAPSS